MRTPTPTPTMITYDDGNNFDSGGPDDSCGHRRALVARWTRLQNQFLHIATNLFRGPLAKLIRTRRITVKIGNESLHGPITLDRTKHLLSTYSRQHAVESRGSDQWTIYSFSLRGTSTRLSHCQSTTMRRRSSDSRSSIQWQTNMSTSLSATVSVGSSCQHMRSSTGMSPFPDRHIASAYWLLRSRRRRWRWVSVLEVVLQVCYADAVCCSYRHSIELVYPRHAVSYVTSCSLIWASSGLRRTERSIRGIRPRVSSKRRSRRL